MSAAPAGSDSAVATKERHRVRVGVLIAYGMIMLIGAAFFGFSFEYDVVKSDGLIGPGFLPRIVGALVAALGAALVVQELRSGSVLVGDSGIAEEESRLSRATLTKLASVFGLMTLALLVMPALGLIVPLTVLVLVVTVVIERMPVIPSVVVTVAAGVVAYLLFVVALRLPIPMGIFEGLL